MIIRRKGSLLRVLFLVAVGSAIFCALPINVTATSGVTREINSTLKRNTLKKKKKAIELSGSQVRKKDSNNRDDPPSAEPIVLPISVKAILLPRAISLRAIVRVVCVCALVISLLGCIKTAGDPSVRVMWEIMHGNSAMPVGFKPSPLEDFLAQRIAGLKDEIIPPLWLPSAPPILGALCSALVFVCVDFLFPRWFTGLRVLLDYHKVSPEASSEALHISTKTKASILLHLPETMLESEASGPGLSTQHSTVIKELENSPITKRLGQLDFEHLGPHFFEMNDRRIYVDVNLNCVDGGPNLHRSKLKYLRALSKKGLSESQRQVALDRYGIYNDIKFAMPTIKEAVLARLVSPLVAIQLLGSVLSVLDDGVLSLLNLAYSLAHHYYNAISSIESIKELSYEVKMNVQELSNTEVLVMESKKGSFKWVARTAKDLLPGDVFALVIKDWQSQNMTVPVDALVLDGSMISNEAVLTGETVPQVKVPLDFEDISSKAQSSLDLDNQRQSIIFSGTSILAFSQETSPSGYRKVPFPKTKTIGAVCLALRTGSYSSKGNLLRSLKSGTNMGEISSSQSDKDSIRLIAGLSGCAFLSCASLFWNKEIQHVSVFRRIVQCTRIAVSSIPTDIPLSIAYNLRLSSEDLKRKSDVVCSRPGSLLAACPVDVVVFDKTGTLTADTQSLSKTVDFPSGVENSDFMRFTLAGCHSLLHLNQTKSGETFAGDPLELAALRYSGWTFCPETLSYENNSAQLARGPVEFWQLKTFPFDPSKKLSSVIVLSRHSDGKFGLFSITKGSPEQVWELCQTKDGNCPDKLRFGSQSQNLERHGYRTIAVGFRDLTESSLAKQLFPAGLNGEVEAVTGARTLCKSLHRHDFECSGNSTIDDIHLEMVGFACFETSVRGSSKRVLHELRQAGITSIMCTGDGVLAAIAVGLKTGLISTEKIAIMDTGETEKGQEILTYKTIKVSCLQDGSIQASSEGLSKVMSAASARKILSKNRKGALSIAATGSAMQLIVSETTNLPFDEVKSIWLEELSCISVIARASPAIKKASINALKKYANHRVAMCGDGVNDVAAMKAADVAVALLSGFGAENKNLSSMSRADVDDNSRRRKVETRRIGSNRIAAIGGKSSTSTVPRPETRVRGAIDQAKKEILQRAAERQGLDYEYDSEFIQLSGRELKELMSRCLDILRKERNRAKKLKKGGGDAARILAEEYVEEDSARDEWASIKPGEVSLIAPFSCLRPSIDGVEAMLRNSISASACCLFTEQSIALNSLESCYRLATIYRGGFRYSQPMLAFLAFSSQALYGFSYRTSSTPRPRLPPSVHFRPRSLFHKSSFVPILFQAVAHTVTMALAVKYAKTISFDEAHQTKHVKTHIKTLISSGGPEKLRKLSDALASHSSMSLSGEEMTRTDFFGRPVFQPSYLCNVAFLFSIFQYTISKLLNHQGMPFYESLSESRPLCDTAGFMLFSVLALVCESFPSMNVRFGLKMLPSPRAKLTFVAILALDVAIGLLGKWAGHVLSATESARPLVRSDRSKGIIGQETAADVEEKLLREERFLNQKRMLLLLSLSLCLILQVVLDSFFRSMK